MPTETFDTDPPEYAPYRKVAHAFSAGSLLIEPTAFSDADVEAWKARAVGRGWKRIAMTHRHDDHGSGVERVAEALGIPVVYPIGGDVMGEWAVLDTPGHCSEHVSFFNGTVLFLGDVLTGHGYGQIAGDTGDYRAHIRSLEACAALVSCTQFIPSHGPPFFDPEALLKAAALEERFIEWLKPRRLKLENEILDDLTLRGEWSEKDWTGMAIGPGLKALQ